MRTIRLTLEYDGTRYAGWQRQAAAPTVQAAVESAVAHVLGRQVEVVGASRTDAGVHAAGQVAHFRTDSRIPPGKWPFVLNACLPGDITVREACPAPDDFHARFSAMGKRYRYTILAQPQPSALWRERAFHVYRPLDVRSMRLAAMQLAGEHDFAAFRDTGCEAPTTVRTIHAAVITEAPPFLYLTVEGNAFLYHMVRILAGTLVDIGTGRLPSDCVPALFASRDRRGAGQTAPACGLCLEQVLYPNDL